MGPFQPLDDHVFDIGMVAHGEAAGCYTQKLLL